MTKSRSLIPARTVGVVVLAGAVAGALVNTLSQVAVIGAGAPWLPDNGAPGIRVYASFSGPLFQALAIVAIVAAVVVLRDAQAVTTKAGLLAAGALAGAGATNSLETALHAAPDWIWAPSWLPLFGGEVSNLGDVTAVLAAIVLSVSLLSKQIPQQKGNKMIIKQILTQKGNKMIINSEPSSDPRPATEPANSANAGFTLIELMVVLLIIGILMAIAIPTYLGEKSKAENTAAETTDRNALTALDAEYAAQNGYLTPPGSTNLATAMGRQEPSLTWSEGGAVSAINNVSILGFDNGSTVGTSEAQGIEVTAWSSAGHCFTAIEIQTSGNGLTAGTYYQISPPVTGACTPPTPPTSTSGLPTTWGQA